MNTTPEAFMQDPVGRKARIIAFFKRTGKWPSPYSSDPEEVNLGDALKNYTCRSQPAFDPEFVTKTRALGRVTGKEKVARKKLGIISFFLAQRRWPSRHSDDPTEVLFGEAMKRYTYKGDCSYDPVFAAQVKRLADSKRATKRKGPIVSDGALSDSAS